ncbi:hypothetical protein ES705_46691 [subsurface metagenome]
MKMAEQIVRVVAVVIVLVIAGISVGVILSALGWLPESWRF